MHEIDNDPYGGMKVIGVMQDKGGVGKTTLSIHTALRASYGYMPRVKKKILLIDVDKQQNASKSLLSMEALEGEGYMIPPIHPAYDPDDDEDPWSGRSNSVSLYYGEPVEPYPSIISDRLEILPADGEVLDSFDKITQGGNVDLVEQIHIHLRKFFELEAVQAEYDLIIIDCPPGKTMISTPVIRAATHIILPTQAENFSTDGIFAMIKGIEKENTKRPYDVNIIGIIPNMVTPNLLSNKAMLQELEKNPLTKKYLAPFILKRLDKFGIHSMPVREIRNSIQSSNKAVEAQIMKFVNYVHDSIYRETGA